MNKYIVNPKPSTSFFNFFRKFFQISFFEKLLIKYLHYFPSEYFQKLVPPEYLYSKGSFRQVKRNGIHFKLDISNLVDHYIYFGLDNINFTPVLATIQSAKVIFDIGANIGSTAMYFSQTNHDAVIFAFEPHPVTYQKAVTNLSLNKFANIHLVNQGLGERTEKLKLYEIIENNSGMNRILPNQPETPYVEIDINTIDSFFKGNNLPCIDFIKIDVEGYEYSVLKGGELTLKKYKPTLFIELDDNYLKDNNCSASALVQLLQSWGYSKIHRADTYTTVSENDDFSNCHYDIIVTN